METLKEKIISLEKRLDLNDSKKPTGWFERHQGLITFLGYLATALIGGVSLYSSYRIATEALSESKRIDSLNKIQFYYTQKKDSLNTIQSFKQIIHQDSLTNKQYNLQDSTGKRQLDLAKQQINTFKGQLNTYKEQLNLAKEEWSILKRKLNDEENANRAILTAGLLELDTASKTNNELMVPFFNRGINNCTVKHFYFNVWNIKNNIMSDNQSTPLEHLITPNSSFPANIFYQSSIFSLNESEFFARVTYQDEVTKKTYDSDYYFSINTNLGFKVHILTPYQIQIYQEALKNKMKKYLKAIIQ